jgi:hypothetical protein
MADERIDVEICVEGALDQLDWLRADLDEADRSASSATEKQGAGDER